MPSIGGDHRWRAVVIAGCAGATVISAIALLSLTSRPELFAVNITAYSLSYLIAGSIAWIQRPHNRVGPIMLAASVMGGLSFFSLHPDPLIWRSAGMSGSLANVLIVWVMLAAPTGRLTPGMSRWALGAFMAVVVAVAAVDDLAVLRGIFAVGVVVSLLLAGIVVRRWMVASRPLRRAMAPVAIAGTAIGLVHAVDFASGVLLVPVLPGTPRVLGRGHRAHDGSLRVPGGPAAHSDGAERGRGPRRRAGRDASPPTPA